VIALTRDLDFAVSRFLTRLSAVFLSAFHEAQAWNMRTLDGQIRRHDGSPFQVLFLPANATAISIRADDLDPTGNQEYDHDKKYESQTASRGIAPLPAMRPAWQRTNKC